VTVAESFDTRVTAGLVGGGKMTSSEQNNAGRSSKAKKRVVVRNGVIGSLLRKSGWSIL